MIVEQRQAEAVRAGLFLRTCRRFVPTPASHQDPVDAVGDHIQFRASLGRDYADRPVVGLTRLESGPIEMRLNRFVLAGLFGCLPEPYLSECSERAFDGDTAFAAFLDIFNHRINALRFISQNADAVSAQQDNEDLSETELGRLLRQLVPDSARFPAGFWQLAELAALLHLKERSLSVAECLLERLLGVNLKLTPFAGGWVTIPGEARTRLGERASRLDQSAVLGRRMWSAAEGVSLDLFLKPFEQYVAFMPGGARYEQLTAVVAWVLRSQFDVHVSCFLDATDHQDFRLKRPWQNRLGRTSRLPETRRAKRTEPVRFVLRRQELSNAVTS